MGWADAMMVWGIGQGIIAILAGIILHHPPKGWLPKDWVQPKAVVQTRKEFSAGQMLSTKEFYVMYFMFLMVCTGGLMTTGAHVANRQVAGTCSMRQDSSALPSSRWRQPSPA